MISLSSSLFFVTDDIHVPYKFSYKNLLKNIKDN